MKFNLDRKKTNSDIKPQQMKLVNDLIDIMCTPEIRSIDSIAEELHTDVRTIRLLIGNPHIKKMIQSRIEDSTLFYEARVWEKLMEKIEMENSLDAIKVFFNLKGKNANGLRESNHISINNNQTNSSGLTPQQENNYDAIVDSWTDEEAAEFIHMKVEDIVEDEEDE